MNSLAEKIENRTARICWIGTGVMGLPMCGHLIDEGFQLSVYTRTFERASSLIEKGAEVFRSLSEAIVDADIIFTMVGFPGDVEEVYFNGILKDAKQGSILIDMTTTRPSLAISIAEKAKEQQILTLDAPVSGGDIGAVNRSLSIMVGGPREAFNVALPLLEIFGKHIVLQGGRGAGQHTKMCNQIVIASTMVGVCESLLYGAKAGLNLETMLSSISGGAAGCWTLNNLAPRILKRNFDPGFFVEHFIKDMGIALEESRRMGLNLTGLNLAHELYLRTTEMGHGRLGTHALMLALESINGIQP